MRIAVIDDETFILNIVAHEMRNCYTIISFTLKCITLA